MSIGIGTPWTVAGVVTELRDFDESVRIEAKRALGKSARASISAFANEPDLGGGWLVFGVERDGNGEYQTVGVAEPDRLQSELSSICRTYFNRVLRPEIRVDRMDDGIVVVAYIAEADATAKPIYAKATGLPKGGYRRIGSTDQHLVDSDLTELASLAQSTPFDRRPFDQATRADFDEAAIALFRQTLQKVRPLSELLDLDTEVLLQMIGALVLNGDKWVPSAAGILLLGSKLALRRLLPSMRLDYIRIRGSAWTGEALESYTTIEIREALITGWRRAFAAIMDDLPLGFHLPDGAAQRRDQPALPDRVVREALINALCHRNYEVHSAIQIRRFSDRIEIESPGHSLVPMGNTEASVSKTRNPTLANLFRDLGLAETRGTGIRRMRERMASAQLAAPEFVSDRGASRFIATFHLHHFLSDDDLSWMKQFSGHALTGAEVRVLAYLRHQGQATNAEIREATGLDTHAVTLLFRALLKRDAIVQNGKGRATYYTLAKAIPGVQQSDLFDAGTQSAPSRHPVGTQSAPSVEQRAVLLLLAVRPLPPKEMRASLGRTDRSKFRSSVLGPMLAAGWIEMTVPEKPRSSKQRYRRTSLGASILERPA